MATQEQLKYLQRQCQYLRYTDKSTLPFVEKFSGSLEQFSPACHTTKASAACLMEGRQEVRRSGRSTLELRGVNRTRWWIHRCTVNGRFWRLPGRQGYSVNVA